MRAVVVSRRDELDVVERTEGDERRGSGRAIAEQTNMNGGDDDTRQFKRRQRSKQRGVFLQQNRRVYITQSEYLHV
jgi:hypothetical protein